MLVDDELSGCAGGLVDVVGIGDDVRLGDDVVSTTGVAVTAAG